MTRRGSVFIPCFIYYKCHVVWCILQYEGGVKKFFRNVICLNISVTWKTVAKFGARAVDVNHWFGFRRRHRTSSWGGEQNLQNQVKRTLCNFTVVCTRKCRWTIKSVTNEKHFEIGFVNSRSKFLTNATVEIKLSARNCLFRKNPSSSSSVSRFDRHLYNFR